MFLCMFFNVFYKSEKNMFLMFFIRKSMFLSSMVSDRQTDGNVPWQYRAPLQASRVKNRINEDRIFGLQFYGTAIG